MNKMCEPIPHPEVLADYPSNMIKAFKNMDAIASWEGLGFSWLRSSRLSFMYYFSYFGLFKLTMFEIMSGKKFREKLQELVASSCS